MKRVKATVQFQTINCNKHITIFVLNKKIVSFMFSLQKLKKEFPRKVQCCPQSKANNKIQMNRFCYRWRKTTELMTTTHFQL